MRHNRIRTALLVRLGGWLQAGRAAEEHRIHFSNRGKTHLILRRRVGDQSFEDFVGAVLCLSDFYEMGSWVGGV